MRAIASLATVAGLLFAAPACQSASPSRTATAKPASIARAKVAQRASLMARAPAPTERLANEVRQRESAGWLAPAILFALLARGDLTREEKTWAEARMQEQDHDEKLLAPVARPRLVHIEAPDLRQGEPARVTVTAAGAGEPGSCSIPGATASQVRGGRQQYDWIPARAGTLVIECESGRRKERRLLLVHPSR